jgi:serine phosphatase RsbU (regulator of sigma subunit)
LGAWRDARWEPESLVLEPGDVLVLYTDGVTDAAGEDGRFGDERLQAALRGQRDAAGAVAAIDRALSAFQVGAQADDTAVLAIDLPVKHA